MRPARLFAAATTAALFAGVLAATAPAHAQTSSKEVPGICPAGTYDSTYLGGDDFDPNTPRSSTWTATPDGSWTESEGALHSAVANEAGAEAATNSAAIALPEGKTSVLRLEHSYSLGDNATEPYDHAVLEIGAEGGWTALETFSGTGETTKEYALTTYDGLEVQLRFRRIADGLEDSGEYWSVADVAVTSCNPATAPSSVRSLSAIGGNNAATVRWAAPSSPGSGGVTKYQILVGSTGTVYETAPTATSYTVGGLTSGINQTFSVRAVSVAGPGPYSSKKLVGTRISAGSPSTIVYGGYAKISGKVYRPDTGSGISGLAIKLQGRKKGATTYSTITTAKTGSGGVYSFSRKPTANYQYRVVYSSGYSTYMGSVSSTRTINVRHKVSAYWSDSTIRVGQESKFYGWVAPNHAGQDVMIQVYYNGSWQNVLEAPLSSQSKYAVYFLPDSSLRGTHYFRAYKAGDSSHYSGWSPSRKIVVS